MQALAMHGRRLQSVPARHAVAVTSTVPRQCSAVKLLLAHFLAQVVMGAGVWPRAFEDEAGGYTVFQCIKAL